MRRRNFLHQSAQIAAASAFAGAHSLFPSKATALNSSNAAPKKKLAMVGTGVRGIGMWGLPVIREFGGTHQFEGLCDSNPGRVATARKAMGLDCPVFTNLDNMLSQVKPDLLIVTSVDGIHHEHIIKGLESGADVITEKPMTIDETKCQAILDAEKRTGKKVRVTFNYRFSPHRQKIYELLRGGAIGRITSVDFHWYLDVRHGADYFRRWHRLRRHSGSLLVHKATHHFDLLNWWIDSDPKEVVAYGGLEFYGKNNPFRHTHCRGCPHQNNCSFYWDITKKKPDGAVRGQ